MQAIKYGTDPLPLSEQEGMDCIRTIAEPCDGANPKDYWEWSKANGSRSESEYPKSYKRKRLSCKSDANEAIVVSQADEYHSN